MRVRTFPDGVSITPKLIAELQNVPADGEALQALADEINRRIGALSAASKPQDAMRTLGISVQHLQGVARFYFGDVGELVRALGREEATERVGVYARLQELRKQVAVSAGLFVRRVDLGVNNQVILEVVKAGA